MLSCYILTFNSEKHLESILSKLSSVVDDLVIIDSGSKDRTESIAKNYQANFIFRKLDNFRDQRNFALTNCKNDWVLTLDSDEVPDEQLVASLKQLKQDNFVHEGIVPDGYKIYRRWFLFDREVHAFMPVSNPDCPMRLFRKSIVDYRQEGNLVHEEATGARTKAIIQPGFILHYSCDSIRDLMQKMNYYTTLAAEDMKLKGKAAGSWFNMFVHAFAAWLKWYFKKGGWKDGEIGVLLGVYAFFYTLLKYIKLRFDFKS